ncbi:pyrimidine reductase family protein [Micromonospora sp. WMMD812]|uniref:pyrimidine reductase family protein n=1 Tax=Micromonospora sp. WMMD812 TaxID=3015152 RepID=UPI00248B2663|nr:pyrimidine reductase family protein [Micromonospora sp. WMMD812]WBB70208.1 pyrimidine reductase family protein [Micromonospora sp. WMMD812]
MSVRIPINQIWPAATSEELDDAALTRLYARTDRPHLRVNFVSSLDGAVSVDGYSAGLSGEPDKRVFGLLRMLCDALVVAAGTLRREGYRAVRLDPVRRAWRRDHGLPQYPTLVVVSGSLHLDPAQAAFADAPVRPVVLTRDGAVPPPGLSDVVDLVPCGTDRVDLVTGLAELRRRGFDQLLCEGGPHLFGALTAADLVDELCLTVAPLLAGPGPGRITAGDGTEPRRLPLRHVLTTTDGMLLLRYART